MYLEKRIQIVYGDITLVDADIIVNAANRSLLGGGGVDGAIHRAAGPELLEYCKALGGCEVGEVVYTPAFQLKHKFIIHTVGPIYSPNDLNCAKLLESCYRKSLLLAGELKARSIAFPEISTGVYGYPKDETRRIAQSVCLDYLSKNSLPEKILFVRFE